MPALRAQRRDPDHARPRSGPVSRMLFCEPHNDAFYQARGWYPFSGEVYAEAAGGTNSLRGDGALCVRFHAHAARWHHRPMRPAVVTLHGCGWLRLDRPHNMSCS